VSASVSGLGIGRATAVAGTLLVAALSAAPARADGTGAAGLPPTTPDSLATYGSSGGGGAITPPPNPVDTVALANNARPAPTAPQDNTATNTQSTGTSGGGGGTATGGNAGPSHVAGAGSQGGSHGGSGFANGGNAESHSNLGNEQSNQASGHDGFGPGSSGDGKDNWGGKDSFVVETPKPKSSSSPAPRTSHARFPALLGLGAASPVTRIEAQRRGHETAKVSPLGDGLTGHGAPLPGRNPFFNLLSGAGGAGAGLMLLLLAVLGASIALPNQRSKAFRMRTPAWRPLAYVPPIELPG
jgi:hypothetical protein